MASLDIPLDMGERAMQITREENEKLRMRGVEGAWIDGEKLAVASMSASGSCAYLSVRMMRWSEILAMKELTFSEIAGLGAFNLDTNTHVLARENEHELLMVAQRGRKPGEPRMGTEMLLAPAVGGVQWTLATNGTVDAPLTRTERSDLVWMKNSLKEFRDELGVDGAAGLRYLGMMIDTNMFIGAFGILGVMNTTLSPGQLDDARRKARDGTEVAALDAIPMEKENLAAYLRVNRGSMVPQLISGLVILGYNRWGEDFLRQADR